MPNKTFPDLVQAVINTRAQFEADLKTLVEVPTISADPASLPDIDRGAELAATILKRHNFETTIIQTSGSPVVLGKFVADTTFPTITIYNHIDVQPAEAGDWQSNPFELEIRGDRYFGRGTTDDKGPALTALYAAVLARDQKVPLNYNVIWELEEEIGSPHFEEFLSSNITNLETDSILVSDSVWTSPGRPTIDYGLRGMITFEVEVETATQDVHSGLAGGLARNPLSEISQIISECLDGKTGRVLVPGFYDDVVEPTAAEISDFLDSGFDLDKFALAHDLTSMRTADPAKAVAAIMAEPTFEVHGIVGGYTGPGIKTVIPPRATAKLSCRLVTGQDPNVIFRQIKDFILSTHPGVRVELENSLGPYLGQFKGPFADAARRAVQATLSTTPSFVREGGSIGAVVTMQRYFNVPIMLLGLSLPADGYHAPNESFGWDQAAGGMKLFVNYFAEISKL